MRPVRITSTFVSLALLLSLGASRDGWAGADGSSIAALGRIEPRGGVRRLAGPSQSVVVISELRVEVGDHVTQGQILAVLDSHPLHQARVEVSKAVLEKAELELARSNQLRAGSVASRAKQEDADMQVKIARARLKASRAELDLSLVRAPISGQVLEIYARAGEHLGPDGILELGRTDEMFAIAEVYETDAYRVHKGQRAVVSSPALASPLEGSVEHVGLRVGKMDVLGTDPVAKTDARVVEVEIRLDDAKAAALLTNLQVKVEILP